MPAKNIGLVVVTDDQDILAAGQPLTYWAAGRAGREEILRQRAEASGATYSHDGSRIGLGPDGEPLPETERERAHRLAARPRHRCVTKADRKAIEQRLVHKEVGLA
jgi:hypothetical protein